jgi:hypothetical protein
MDMKKIVALGLGVVVLGVVLLALLWVQDGYRQRQASFASSPRGQLLSMLKITRPCVNDVYRTADATEAAAIGAATYARVASLIDKQESECAGSGTAVPRITLHYDDHGWSGAAEGAMRDAVYMARQEQAGLRQRQDNPSTPGWIDQDPKVAQNGYGYLVHMVNFTLNEADIVGLRIPQNIRDEVRSLQPSDMPYMNADAGYGRIARIYTMMELEAVGAWSPGMTVDAPDLKGLLAHPLVSPASLRGFVFAWGAHTGSAMVSPRTATIDLNQRTYASCDPLASYPCAEEYHVTVQVERITGNTVYGRVVRTSDARTLPLRRQVTLMLVPCEGFLQVQMPGTPMDGAQYCNPNAAGGACGA